MKELNERIGIFKEVDPSAFSLQMLSSESHDFRALVPCLYFLTHLKPANLYHLHSALLGGKNNFLLWQLTKLLKKLEWFLQGCSVVGHDGARSLFCWQSYPLPQVYHLKETDLDGTGCFTQ